MIPTMLMPEAMEDSDQMPVDPLELVDALGPLLGPQGDVLGEDEAEKLVRFMKDSPKLVSQSICCNIVRATTDWSILMKLAGSGMWETLYEWLQDAKGDADVTMQLLEVYIHLPVSINLLKRNSCAKLIKNLTKDPRQDVSSLAGEIVEKWTAIIRGDAVESIEKERLKKKAVELKRKDGPAMSTSAPPAKSAHNSATGSKSKLVTSDVKSKDSSSKSKDGKVSSANVKSSAADNKPKPQTVKVAPVKLRSTGLEQDIQIPVKKKGDKLPHKRANPSTSALPASSASQEKRLKLTISTAGGVTSSSLSTVSPTSANTDVPGKIKLIPPKKPLMESYESSSFMDALLPKPGAAPIVKKRRLSVSKSNGVTPTSPSDKQLPQSPSDSDGAKAKVGEEKIKGRDDKVDTAVNGESRSKSGKKKKSVRWVEESRLKMFHYFELDEDERINVNKVHHSFADTKKAERMMEGKAFHTAKLLDETEGGDDKMAAAPINGWRTPQPIELATVSTFVSGCNSSERDVQKQRELSVLQALFFSKDMLPDTPSEPDIEPYEPNEPHNVPLRDEASDTEVAFPAYPLPVDTAQWHQQQRSLSLAGGPAVAAPFSLPPDLARLLADMAQTSVMNSSSPVSTMTAGASPGPLLPSPAQPSAPWGVDGATTPTLPSHIQAMVGTLMSQTAGGTMPAAPGTEELMGTLRRALEPMLNNINALQALVPQPVLYMLWPQGPPPPPMGGMRPQYGLLGHTPPAFNGPAPYGRLPPRMGEWGPMGPMMRGRPPVGPMRPRFAHPAMAGPPRGQVCKFFGTARGCTNGDQCPYIHHRPAPPPAANA